MSKIIPYVGLDNIKLYSTYAEVKQYLKNNKINYKVEVWSNKGCTPEIPWVIIRVNNSISLFFAKEKLFKIYIEEGCEDFLPNGIKIGTAMEDVLKIDNTLEFDDWNEIWISKQGYWVENELDNNTVMTITVFIKELENNDVFDKYEW